MKTIIVILSVVIMSMITTWVSAQDSNTHFIYNIKIEDHDSEWNAVTIEIRDTARINDEFELCLNGQKYRCFKTDSNSIFHSVIPALKFGDLIIVQSKTRDSCFQAIKFISKK